MGKGPHKTYPKENNEKEKALRRKILEQDREISRLKSELKTLNNAFSKTAQYIKGNMDGVSVEKIIAGSREAKTMVEIKAASCCPECGEELKTSLLPFGRMDICSAACGYRNVSNGIEE